MKDRFIRRPEVETIAGYRRSQIYKLIAEGKFPKPARIGGSVRWSEREIENWIAARLAERSHHQPKA